MAWSWPTMRWCSPPDSLPASVPTCVGSSALFNLSICASAFRFSYYIGFEIDALGSVCPAADASGTLSLLSPICSSNTGERAAGCAVHATIKIRKLNSLQASARGFATLGFYANGISPSGDRSGGYRPTTRATERRRCPWRRTLLAGRRLDPADQWTRCGRLARRGWRKAGHLVYHHRHTVGAVARAYPPARSARTGRRHPERSRRPNGESGNRWKIRRYRAVRRIHDFERIEFRRLPGRALRGPGVR